LSVEQMPQFFAGDRSAVRDSPGDREGWSGRRQRDDGHPIRKSRFPGSGAIPLQILGDRIYEPYAVSEGQEPKRRLVSRLRELALCAEQLRRLGLPRIVAEVFADLVAGTRSRSSSSKAARWDLALDILR
jgi:hypothetical protein